MKPTKTMLMIDAPTTYLAEAAHAAMASNVAPTTSSLAGLRRSGFEPAFARRPAR
jgi:hypothetical protein